MTHTRMTPAQRRQLGSIRQELIRLVRYDDESIVHDEWIRQRYDGGYAATYLPARKAAVVTAWHKAGHVAAALAAGATFSSASIRQGTAGAGRVHSIRGGGPDASVIDAAGQIAERLRDWTMLENDDGLRVFLKSWRADGGDAKHFRDGITTDEFSAWRRAEQALTPLRLQIRHLARALLVHPRPIPYAVASVLYHDGNPVSESSTTSAPAS